MVAAILSFWSTKVPIYGYVLLLWGAFLAFQLLGVTAFGEAEFWLALVKLVGLVAYFIFSIVYISGGIKGHPAFGFHYWNDPGAFANGFRGVASVFVFCSTFYAGCESVAVAATETRNPRVAIPRAIRQVFWRIIFIYMGSAIFFGATVPYNAPGLAGSSSKVLASPMTIAIQNAGWQGGVHLVNTFILVTCVSAINSSIYIGSRTVLYMGQDGKAPKILGKTDKRGVPVAAIIFTNLFGFLSLMNVSTGAAKAYSYIVNLSGVSTFIVWGSISFIHLRFRKAWAVQGHSADELPFKSALFPWNPYFGWFANLFLALVQGWSTFSPWDAGTFVDAYILLPLTILIFVGYKVIFKTHWWRAHEIDLNSGRRKDVDVSDESTIESEPITHVVAVEAPPRQKKTLFQSIARNF
jgi:amino acid transporter